MWLEEKIPNESEVFTRIYKFQISSKDNTPKKSAFINTPEQGNDRSCDWDKYCSAQESLDQISKEKNSRGEYKTKEDFFIWGFSVDSLRKIDSPKQEVLHRPIHNSPELDGVPNNRAHAGIFGSKPTNDAKFRTALLRAGKWKVPPPEIETTK